MKIGLKLFLSAFVSIALMWPLFLAQPKLAPVLKSPTTQLFTNGGDGWKNVYTVAFHTVHDGGLIETQAFNYPDGEHIAFADGQPLLTWILKGVGVDRIETIYAVVQLLPFIGCIFGAILLTWLLLRLRMPLVYAILFGIGIALLSPQMTRSTGHFGLSYVFALPLILHLLMNWTKQRSWASVGWLTLAIICLGQLHLYMLASGLLLACSFMAFTQLIGWKGSGLRVFAQILTLALVCFAVSKGIVDLLWFVADRPAAPYGLKAYTTPWEDVIINRDLPWWSWFSANVSKIRKPGGFEGKGYVGIVTGMFIFYLLVRYVLVKIFSLPLKQKTNSPAFGHLPSEEARRFLVTLCYVSLIAFIVASGFWLVIPGTEFVLDRLGAIRQFRSLGRFIWVGYYSIQVVCAVVVTFWCLMKIESSKHKGSFFSMNFFRVLPLALALLLIWEGNDSLSNIFADPLPPKYDLASWKDAIGNPEAYQAILPLPYFHEGSENYSPLAQNGQVSLSTLFSLKTGLPNMGVMMSRQSLSLTRERLGLNKPWSEIPAVLKKLDPSKPIIILGQRITMRENDQVNSAHDYKPWFAEVDTIFMDDEALILSFLPSEENLDKVLRNYCEVWTANAVSASELEGRVYANALADNWQLLEGQGGASSTSFAFQELHRWARPGKKANSGWEALMVNWMAFVGEDGYLNNEYELRATDSSTGETVVVSSVRPSTDLQFYLREWGQMKIWVPGNTLGNELSLWGKMARHPKVKDLTIRNLVVVPMDSSVIWLGDHGLMKDGLLLQACD